MNKNSGTNKTSGIDVKTSRNENTKTKKPFRYKGIKVFISTTRFNQFKNARIRFNDYIKQQLRLEPRLRISLNCMLSLTLDRRIGLSIDPKIYKEIKAMASENRLTISQTISILLEDAFTRDIEIMKSNK